MEDFTKTTVAGRIEFRGVSEAAIHWVDGQDGYFGQFYKDGVYRFTSVEGAHGFRKHLQTARFTVRDQRDGETLK
jgi:GH24 family phage-related lysozyme (muramidase)